jgi:hypothetical protein
LAICLIVRKILRYEHVDREAVGAAALVIFASLALWFFKAPDPRFGVGVFILAAPVAAVLVFGVPVSSGGTLLRNIHIAALAILVMAIGVIKGIASGNLMTFDLLSVPAPEVIAQSPFGVRPKEGDQCWLVGHCAPYDRTAPVVRFGYRLFPAK